MVPTYAARIEMVYYLLLFSKQRFYTNASTRFSADFTVRCLFVVRFVLVRFYYFIVRFLLVSF